MPSYNRVILVGNLTSDPELRYTPNGTAVGDIDLAVSDRKKKGEEWVEETTFINDIILWGRTAEVASEYLLKGSSVLIEGRLQLDTWESNGQKRSRLKVIAERMQMLGDKSRKAESPPVTEAAQPEPAPEPPAETPSDSDIPF